MNKYYLINFVDHKLFKIFKIKSYLTLSIEHLLLEIKNIKLYESLVRPHLENVIQAWAQYIQKYINRIESVQKRAIRLTMKRTIRNETQLH